MKPLTVTLFGSAGGVCRRCATDNGAAAYARVEEWKALLRHAGNRGWSILMRVLERMDRELVKEGRAFPARLTSEDAGGKYF